MSRKTFLLTPVPLSDWTLRSGRCVAARITRLTAGMGKPITGFCRCQPGPVDVAVTQVGPSETPKLQVTAADNHSGPL